MEMLKLLIIDVDGTMTDSGLYYDNNGNELKKFSTKDAAGFFSARSVGIKIMVLTGRKSEATNRRMKELKVDYLYQGVKNKKEFLREFFTKENILSNEVGFIGDDLNDYSSMKLCGYVACPQNSCPEILQISNYVSKYNGGDGAVRDIVEHYLKERKLWETALANAYGIGI